jgi:hypothetical protein
MARIRWTWERVADFTHTEGCLCLTPPRPPVRGPGFRWAITQKDEPELITSLADFVRPIAPSVRVERVKGADIIVVRRRQEVKAIADRICRHAETRKLKRQCEEFYEAWRKFPPKRL